MKKQLIIPKKQYYLYNIAGVLMFCLMPFTFIGVAKELYTAEVMGFAIIVLAALAAAFKFALHCMYACPNCEHIISKRAYGFDFFHIEVHKHCPECGVEVEVVIE